jgi:hypothetical protein
VVRNSILGAATTIIFTFKFRSFLGHAEKSLCRTYECVVLTLGKERLETIIGQLKDRRGFQRLQTCDGVQNLRLASI